MTSFLNSEMILSVIQLTEIQYKAYQKFMELSGGDRTEAARQTGIFISAIMHRLEGGGSNSKEQGPT